MISLEWKSMFSAGSPSVAEPPRQRHHVVQRRVRRAQPDRPDDPELPEVALRRVRLGRAGPRHLPRARPPAVEPAGDGHLEHLARARPRRVVVGEEVRSQRRVREVGPALVALAEQRRDARLDEVPVPLERSDVIGGEPEPAGPVRDGPLADGRLDRLGQRGQLRIELRRRQRSTRTRAGTRRRARTAGVSHAWWCAPTSQVPLSRSDAQHVGRARVARHGPRDDVGGPHAVAPEEIVQARQRVQVLEGGQRAGRRAPLVVALGVDADEQGGHVQRSWSESPSVTCQPAVSP